MQRVGKLIESSKPKAHGEQKTKMNTGHDVEDVAIKMSADTHAEKRVLRTRHDIATEGCLKSRSGHTKIQPPPHKKKAVWLFTGSKILI